LLSPGLIDEKTKGMILKKDSFWDAIRQRVSCDHVWDFDSHGRAECVYGNSHSPAMTYWKRTNSWYCFKCHIGGDVIDLYAHKNNMGKKEAGIALAKEFKIAIDPDDERKMQLAATVDAMFIDFAAKCHEKLKISPLWEAEKKKRGFTEETMVMFQVGLVDRDIQNYMDKTYTVDDLKRAGFLNEKGNWTFGARMVYPYMGFNKKPIYFIYRLIPGQPDFRPEVKYAKQIVSISDIVENQLFGLNSLSIHDKDVLIITEGITDAMNVIQAGYPCISAVTTRFRKDDFEKVTNYCESFKKVVVLNDNDASGDSGTMNSVEFLLAHAIPVFAGKVPPPKNKECKKCKHWIKEKETDKTPSKCELQIDPNNQASCSGFDVVPGFDLNDYLRVLPIDQHNAEMTGIIDASQEGWEYLFDKLPQNASQTEIESIVKNCPDNEIVFIHVVELLKSRFGIGKNSGKRIIRHARGDDGKKSAMGSDDWAKIRDEIVNTSPFLFISNGLKDEGYWVKAVDSLYSSYTIEVWHEFRHLIRKQLEDIGLWGSANVTEMQKQAEELDNISIGEFGVNRNIIHYNNCLYFIKEDVIVPRTALDLPDELKNYSIKTLRVIPTNLIIEGFVDAPRFTTTDVKILDDPFALSADVPEWKFTWQTLFSDDIYIYEWERMLHRTLDNPKHPGQYDRFWEWLGFCYTDMINKKAAIMRGVPDTGKSSTFEVFLNAFGPTDGKRENVLMDLSLYSQKQLVEICNPDDKEISGAMYGKKINYDDDIGDRMIKNFETFKKITGHEKMNVRFLFQNSFVGTNTVKFTCGANRMPPVLRLNMSFAIRWLPFFFDNVFDEEEKDKPLVDQMVKSQRLLEYITRKAFFAFKRLWRRGLRFEGMPADDVLHWWRMEADSTYAFIERCCVRVSTVGDSEVQKDLYEAFIRFKDANMDITDVENISQGDFTKRLKTFGFPVKAGGKRERFNSEKKETEQISVKVYFGLQLDQEKFNKEVGIEDSEANPISKGVRGISKDTLDSHIAASGTIVGVEEPKDDILKDLIMEILETEKLSANDINVKLAERIKEINVEVMQSEKKIELPTMKKILTILSVMAHEKMITKEGTQWCFK
jgi:hypothetical protein